MFIVKSRTPRTALKCRVAPGVAPVFAARYASTLGKVYDRIGVVTRASCTNWKSPPNFKLWLPRIQREVLDHLEDVLREVEAGVLIAVEGAAEVRDAADRRWPARLPDSALVSPRLVAAARTGRGARSGVFDRRRCSRAGPPPSPSRRVKSVAHSVEFSAAADVVRRVVAEEDVAAVNRCAGLTW